MTGSWSATETISATTTFIAKTSTATSSAVTVKVISTVKLGVKVGRHGVVRVTVTGGPSKRGTVVLWERIGRKWVKIGKASVRGGAVTWTLHRGEGSHSFRATYTSSGCATSSVVGATVRVST